MDLTNKIRTLRQTRGLTQEALAAELGVTSQAVSKWERGTTVPDVALLPELAVFFGVTLDELFGLTEEKEFDRIQNMIWDRRLLPPEDLSRAERWLEERIRGGYRGADCWRLKAELYNHQADMFRDQAAEAAKTALTLDPDCYGAHSELNRAMGGYIPDWNGRNHFRQIAWYQDFTAKHPENWRAWMWLLDNLLDDGRLAEAEAAVEGLAKADATFRTPLYRGLLRWKQGRPAEAREIWSQMEADDPSDWRIWFSQGDVLASEGRYREALEYYRKAISLQTAPRFVDGYVSIAQIHEILGEYEAAVAAREEELAVLASDWNTTKGETADVVRREIQRLKSLCEA